MTPRLLLLACAMLAIRLSAGSAMEVSIGVCADADENQLGCPSTLTPYLSHEVHIFAVFDKGFLAGIEAARFRVNNFPELPDDSYGVIEESWTSEYVSGDIRSSFSIYWDSPQGGDTGCAKIGTITITVWEPAWIGPDWLVQVRESEDCGCLEVYGPGGEAIPAVGESFVFNCDPYSDCSSICSRPRCFVAVGGSTWSTVKSLY